MTGEKNLAQLDDDALESALRDAVSRRQAGDEAGVLADSVGAPMRDFPTGSRGVNLHRAAVDIFQPARPGVLRMVLRAIGDTLQVLDVIGDQLAPVTVRGGARKAGVLVRHTFAGREVTAHVSATTAPRFVVTLDLWGDQRAATDWRVSLLRGRRELASEIPRRGRVLFPDVEAGRYRVVLCGPDGYVGELDLTFEEAAA